MSRTYHVHTNTKMFLSSNVINAPYHVPRRKFYMAPGLEDIFITEKKNF